VSFANEIKRAVKEITEEIAFYRGFATLEGIAEPLEELEEMRDRWDERRERFEARGRPPSEPSDWDEDKTLRRSAKERLDKIIKIAAEVAAAAAISQGREAPPAEEVG
jgi:hypothetical protein